LVAARAQAQAQAETQASSSDRRTLTVERMCSLFGLLAGIEDGAQATGADAGSGVLGVLGVLERLYEHVLAEAEQAEAAKAAASLTHKWHVRTHWGGGGGAMLRRRGASGSAWIELDKAACLTLDAELRAGRPSACLTKPSGERVCIDFHSMTGTPLGAHSGARFEVRAEPQGASPTSCAGGGSGSGKPTGGEAAGGEDVECAVCFSEPATPIPGCGCRMCCRDCLTRHAAVKIRDGEVLAWVPCPATDCGACLPASLLCEILQPADCLALAKGFLVPSHRQSSPWPVVRR